MTKRDCDVNFLRRLQAWSVRNPTPVFLILSACSVVLLYKNVLGAAFVYDDHDHIQLNSALLSWHSLYARYFSATVPFSGEFRSGAPGAHYRPLFWLSLALDRQWFGLNPLPFHLTNLLLHWLNGLLGFVLLRRLGFNALRAMALPLIWLALPINCEAVAWVSGRPICLCTAFILLSLWFADRYLSSQRMVFLWCYTAAAAFAVLSYEGGLLVIPLVSLWAYATNRVTQRSFLLLILITCGTDLIYFVVRANLAGSLPSPSASFFSFGLSILKYIQWMVLPIHMSVERSTDTPLNVISFASVIALCAVALLVVVTFRSRRKVPEFSAGVAWMLIALLPFSGLVFLYQGMAERYTYLASLGFVFAIAGLVWNLPNRPRQWLLCVVLAWVLWGAWRLDTRVRDWRNDTSLYLSSLKTDPDSAILLYNIGLTREDSGHLEQAFVLIERALELKPRYSLARNGLGTIYLRRGLLKKAQAQFEQAIALNPDDASAIANLGVVYLQLGLFDQARNKLESAVALKSDDTNTLVNLGIADFRLGDLTAAEHRFKQAIAFSPREISAYCNLSSVLFKEGNWVGAVDQLTTAMRLEPSNPAPYYFLGAINQQMGARDAAILMYKKALQVSPGYPAALSSLKQLDATAR